MINFVGNLIFNGMKAPFIYGKIANNEDFTDREMESKHLLQNFRALVNTTIIAPRRWGKTSLVNKVADQLEKKYKDIIVCKLDLFNCRTAEQFYSAFSKAALQSSKTTLEEFMANVRRYLGRFAPTITFSDSTQSYELSFGVDFKDRSLSLDEILDLPQKLATDSKKQVVMCIDEFQNIKGYDEPLAFQKKLRSHWQHHSKVCYCLYGSKRHMLMDIFTNYSMPFYKFGDIMFLQKIQREDWIKFIAGRFKSTGKQISDELCGEIAGLMKCHSYYTQQLSQQVWLRTEKVCNKKIVEESFAALINQLSLLFTTIIDALTPKQINFLLAIVAGETNFSSKEVLKKYDLGTSANIKNLRKATLEKDLIDILPGNKLEIQDPVFECWLMKEYK